MIAVKGMVIRCSQIIPDLKVAFFRCVMCSATTEVCSLVSFIPISSICNDPSHERNQSNPIQSNPIQSNPIQSNPIQSNPIQSNPINQL